MSLRRLSLRGARGHDAHDTNASTVAGRPGNLPAEIAFAVAVILILLAGSTMSSCTDPGKDAEQEYLDLSSNATDAQKCAAASEVARRYYDQEDTDKYPVWRDRSKGLCAAVKPAARR